MHRTCDQLKKCTREENDHGSGCQAIAGLLPADIVTQKGICLEEYLRNQGSEYSCRHAYQHSRGQINRSSDIKKEERFPCFPWSMCGGKYLRLGRLSFEGMTEEDTSQQGKQYRE